MARAATSELVVPLRKAWNITRFKRFPRAIQIIRDEVIRHLKVLPEEEIYIDPSVNEKYGKEELRIHRERFDSPSFATMSPISQSKSNCMRRPEYGKYSSKFYQNPSDSSS